MTKMEKECVVRALEVYKDSLDHTQEQSADIVRERCMAAGLLCVFKEIVNEPCGTVKI